MTTRATSKPRKRRKDAGRPKELSEAHKEKMRVARERKRKEREKAEVKDEQKALRESIKRLQAHLAKSVREDDKAYARYRRSSGEKNFNLWLRANTNLLNATTALSAHEQRLTT
jgi:hypothetical protein